MDSFKEKSLVMRKWISEIVEELKKLDGKIVIILISILVFQAISYYFVSTEFFRLQFENFSNNLSLNSFLENLFWVAGDFCCFFIFPWLIIKFFLNEKLNQYGLLKIQLSKGWKYILILMLIVIVIAWFVTSLESISFTHPLFYNAKTNWNLFFAFEILMLIYIFAWEFLWRGYMLFGLETKFGWYAIFIQTIPFVILHNGKPAIETFSSILGGILLGIIALKTRTFLYGVIMHFSLMFFIDLFSVIRFRANEFGIGLNSFFNIIGK